MLEKRTKKFDHTYCIRITSKQFKKVNELIKEDDGTSNFGALVRQLLQNYVIKREKRTKGASC